MDPAAVKKWRRGFFRAAAIIALPFLPGVLIEVANRFFGLLLTSADNAGAFLLNKLIEWMSLPLRNPVETLWGAFSLLMVYLFFRDLWPAYRSHRKRKYLLQAAGLESYFRRDLPERREASWEECKRSLSDPGNDQIWIMGANGWETFGAATAPLHQIMDRFRGTMRVMLLHPMSPWVDARAASAREDAKRYRDWAVRSVVFCRELRNKGKAIEVALFDWAPVWKLVIARDRLWLQHYEDDKPVDETSAFSFCRGPATSLYHSFRTEFQRSWDSAEKIDLSLGNKQLKAVLSRPPRGNCELCKDVALAETA